MNPRIVTLIILAVVGIPLLVLIGQWSATDPVLAGLSALVVIGIFILLQLGSRCWLLIPFFSAFTGSLVAVPGHFAPRDLAVGIVLPILMSIWVIRRFPLQRKFGAIEVLVLLLMFFVAQAFLRNPVGLSVTGSESIGARPYFEIAVSLVSFLILSSLVVDLKSIRMMIIAAFAGSIASGLWETATGLLPAFAFASASIYRGETASVGIKQYLGLSGGGDSGTQRMVYLKYFPQPIMNLMLSFRSPLQFVNPRYFLAILLILFAAACVLLSGFRSGIAMIGMMVVAAAILHRRGFEVVILSVIGLPLLGALLILQGNVIQLPLPAQRALSFLPGDWDSRATLEAEGSSEWRFEMWKLALTSDRYIRNKWLGDGYGFSADEMEYQTKLQLRGIQDHEMQDYYLVIGSFHSGPIETIKRVGYLGLAVLLIFMLVVFRYSVRLVNRSRGTPYQPYAIFVALPIVILPFVFIIIFGAFQQAVTQLLLACGMMRMISCSLENHIRYQRLRADPAKA